MAQPSHAAVRSVVITGGLGFLGRLVCRSLLRGVNGGVASAVRVKLVDVDADQMSSPSLSAPSRSDADDRALAAEILEDALGSGSSEQTLHSSVEIVRGNISDSEFCRSIIGDETDSVFHLAAVMSGQGEADFESVMDVNLHGTLNLLEAVRNSGSHGARFLFASSGAVFGSTANESAHYTQMHAQDNPPPARDSTKHLPESSYGMTKSCCELLVNDYTRRGFVIGRSARLPTVVVRPGAPNAATTSVFSSVVRDTLEGIACESPLSLDLSHAVVSHRTAVDSVIQLHDTDEGEFLRLAPFAGLDRAVNLHATSVTLGELYEETSRIVQKGQDKPRENLGPLHVNINEKLEGIVASMPSRIESATAKALGLPGAHHTARDLVRIYCEDFAPHIDTSPHESDISASAGRDASVVAFMGLGNMGKSMARNIINSGNFEEVRLWNRTKESAQTFAVSMENIHYRGSGPTTKVTVCDSPREAAEGASVTMICLGTEKACEDVLLDPDSGLLTRDGDGESGRETVIVDHSTVSPDLTHRCHDLANQADGVVFLDCPISGGPEGAAGGTLSVMCGGDESAFAVAKPVLECMGSNGKFNFVSFSFCVYAFSELNPYKPVTHFL